MSMKNKSLSIWCVTLSCVSLLFSFAVLVRYCPLVETSFDYMGVIVSVLGLLVTILIGWQIFQSIYSEDRMQKAIQSASEKASRDYVHITRGVSKINEARLRNSQIAASIVPIDMMFDAVELFLGCSNTSLSYPLIDDSLRIIQDMLEESGKDGERRILSGRLERYRDILKRTHSTYISAVDRLLSEARQVSLEYEKTLSDKIIDGMFADAQELD